MLTILNAEVGRRAWCEIHARHRDCSGEPRLIGAHSRDRGRTARWVAVRSLREILPGSGSDSIDSEIASTQCHSTFKGRHTSDASTPARKRRLQRVLDRPEGFG